MGDHFRQNTHFPSIGRLTGLPCSARLTISTQALSPPTAWRIHSNIHDEGAHSPHARCIAILALVQHQLTGFVLRRLSRVHNKLAISKSLAPRRMMFADASSPHGSDAPFRGGIRCQRASHALLPQRSTSYATGDGTRIREAALAPLSQSRRFMRVTINRATSCRTRYPLSTVFLFEWSMV